jgi:hypothetical protein
MARRTGPETVADWTARNGVTIKAMEVAARTVTGYGPNAKHYKVTLDRDGADAVFFCDWVDDGNPAYTGDPTPIVENLRDIAIDVEQIRDDAATVKARYAMGNPETEWKTLLNEITDLRVRFMSWCGPLEFAKLVKTDSVSGEVAA